MAKLPNIKQAVGGYIGRYRNEVSTDKTMSTKEILSFGMVEFGRNASSVLISSFMNVYLTLALGVSPVTISYMLTVGVILGYIRGPLISPIMDVTHTKMGRFKPYVVICMPLAALLSLAFFVNPFSSDETMKIAWVYVMYLSYDLISSIGTGAWNNLQMCITRNDSEKRQFFAIARGLNVISGLIPSMLPILIDVCPMIGISIRTLFIALSILMCIIGFFSTMMARNLRERVQLPRREKILQNVKMVFKNKNVIIQWFGNLGGLFSYTAGIAGTYVFIYCYGAYSWQTIVWTFAGICAWATLFLSKRVFKRFDPKTVRIIYQLSGVIASVALFIVGYGKTWNYLIALIAIKMFASLFEYVDGVATNMFNTNVWDHYEWKYGIRNESTTGLIGSWVVLPISVVSPLIYGAIFKRIGFDATNAVSQSEETMQGLFFLYTIFTAISTFLSVAPLFFIKLDRNKMAFVHKELEERARRKALREARGSKVSLEEEFKQAYKPYFFRAKPATHYTTDEQSEFVE